MSSTSFFADLQPCTSFDQLFSQAAYTRCPRDWYAVVADVRGSTVAIEEGRYKDVNVLGVAAIASAVNACEGIEIPYVFGGDGATSFVPAERLDATRASLRHLCWMGQELFHLEMVCGAVAVAELEDRGHEALVAKLALADGAALAMFSGSGALEAEHLIKSGPDEYRFEVELNAGAQSTFDGLECRWQPFESRNGVIASILVQAAEQGGARELYSRVWQYIGDMIGEMDPRPVSESNAHLAVNSVAFNAEAMIRTGTGEGSPAFIKHRRRARRLTRIGRALMKLKLSLGGFDGKNYPQETVSRSDFRKFDGIMRLVLDLTEGQARQVRDFLEREHAAGNLYFGLHEQSAALMTCYVRDYRSRHVHFIDGAGGGYAVASKQLKAQLRGGSR